MASSRAARFPLVRDYKAADPRDLTLSPNWCVVVVRNGVPVSYSRRLVGSVTGVLEGGFERLEEPLVIVDDCTSLSITSSKRSHTKQLNATLKHTLNNYLSPDQLAPGDWVFAWMWTSDEDLLRVVKQVRAKQPCNGFADGLKFVGNIHSVRKALVQSPSGQRSVHYTLVATGFDQFDAQFMYNMYLATAAAQQRRISTWMAQLGLNFTDFWGDEVVNKGYKAKDNVADLVPALIDLVVGKGIQSDDAERPFLRAREAAGGGVVKGQIAADAPRITPTPQSNKEAPSAYLIPRTVAALLGSAGPSKRGVYGYADILQTVIGAQEYDPTDESELMFVPLRNPTKSSGLRQITSRKLHGTFLPVNPDFFNRPLWSMLQQYLNPCINEMYTALRPAPDGTVMPTLVMRQIPFSTEAGREDQDFPLTRFLSLPRWVIHPTMVTSLDIGRSDATRVNYLQVTGAAVYSAANNAPPKQMLLNPPVFDEVDIQRSGLRAMVHEVNLHFQDQRRPDGARVWMEAMADWTFGSHLTLNGTITCYGIQSPIAEGDNVEFEGVAYHLETITHRCDIDAAGNRSFRTVLEVSNGMPVDQGDVLDDAPRYPGFRNVTAETRTRHQVDAGGTKVVYSTGETRETTLTEGDNSFMTQHDPGVAFDTVMPAQPESARPTDDGSDLQPDPGPSKFGTTA